MMISRRRGITADEDPMMEEDVMVDDIDVDEEGAGDVDIDPAATDLLFEAEDVAELVAEITGDEVAVTVDEDAVVFEIGEEQYTVIPEGDEEILESANRTAMRGKRRVAASRKVAQRRPAKAPAKRTVAASRSTRRPAVKASKSTARRVVKVPRQ